MVSSHSATHLGPGFPGGLLAVRKVSSTIQSDLFLCYGLCIVLGIGAQNKDPIVMLIGGH